MRANPDPSDSNLVSAKAGRTFYFAGWAVLILSIVFALSNKSSDPQHLVGFWISLAILATASLGLSCRVLVFRSLEVQDTAFML